MRHTDVAIVGSGLSGSVAAAMLGRAGIDAVAIDPQEVYPPDFRCEKLDGPQMRTLELTGLAEAVRRVTTPDRDSWLARFGHLVERRAGDQHGIFYDTLVNTVRAEIDRPASLMHGKVADIATGPERQTVTLADGEQISARLLILANGLNVGLRQKLGMTRSVISPGHSISIGFDIRPIDRAHFDFSSLTYYFDRPARRMAYLTLFPIGAGMRANLFSYRDLHDPWFQQLRASPVETLFAAMPGLRNLTGDFAVDDGIKIRPVDLYVTKGHRRGGVVSVGDAFATSCPAAGTGARKALTDVERLCNVHIPQWLASPGMGADKITAFYDDPVKTACDANSLAKAYDLRAFCIDTGPAWTARRWARLAGQWSRGAARHMFHDPAADSRHEQPVPGQRGRWLARAFMPRQENRS
jgi:2-polyprenyl-6-methoxyphenol hydroxylase-like FAD-dependent oxidoreductase